MKPQRSKERLQFIRSLPCCVCGRTRNVEAAHVGKRGMGQKCSDFETIPLCSLHHAEQHQVGLRNFEETYGFRGYGLSVYGVLALLREKPVIHSMTGCNGVFYVCMYRGELIELDAANKGLAHSIKLMKDSCREILTQEILQRVQEFQKR